MEGCARLGFVARRGFQQAFHACLHEIIDLCTVLDPPLEVLCDPSHDGPIFLDQDLSGCLTHARSMRGACHLSFTQKNPRRPEAVG